MNLSKFFISRPVLSWVINILIALSGYIGLRNSVLRENPQVDFPVIEVRMEYPGANPKVVESQIANPMEEEFASLEGLKGMSTTISKEGEAKINMTFDSGRSIDSISSDVDSTLRRVRGVFPPNLKDPQVRKSSSNNGSFITLAVFGDKYTSSELSDIAYRHAKNSLESVNGVSSVKVAGMTGEGKTYRIDVWLDPYKLKSFNLTAMDVYYAISKQTYLYPAGNIESNNIRYSVTLANELSTVSEFEEIVIQEKNRNVVKIKEVAKVEMQNADHDVRTRYDGKVCSLVNIDAQSRANQIQIASEIKNRLPDINKALPSGVRIEVALDRSESIKVSVNRVVQSIFEAVILVVIVMILFLKSWKASLIPVITIPICLLSGFTIIYLLGYTINLITLLSMVLAVGLVVDDAIVAIEIIHKRLKKESAKEAAINGMNEIQFSIIAMTLTLVAVYAPIGFSTGIVGSLFKEFSVTLAGMVLVSGLVAIILAPVMSSYLLVNDSGIKAYPVVKFEKYFKKLESGYEKYLSRAVEYRNIVIFFGFLFGLSGLVIGKFFLRSEVMPIQDQGMLSLEIRAPSGANVKYMEYPISKAEEIIKKHPGVRSTFSSFYSGEGKASITILLKSFSDRESAFKISKSLNDAIRKQIPNLSASVSVPSGSIGGKANQLEFSIKSSKSYDELEKFANKVSKIVHSSPAVESVQVSRISPEKTYDIKINRDRALSLGVDLGFLKENIAMIMRGNPPAYRYEREGKRYPVSVWADQKFRSDPEGIKQFYVKTNVSEEDQRSIPKLVSLKDIVVVEETKNRPFILHEDGVRAFNFVLGLKPNNDVIETYNEIKEGIYKIIPQGYVVSPGRDVRTIIEEGNNFLFIIGLSLLFVFFIMAAQFESFAYPAIIMLSVPLALSGAIFTIFLFSGSSFNVYSQIGLITLIGLITKHGILIVEFFKKELEQSKDPVVSVIKASSLRLKPIVMTTFAMVLGAVPLLIPGSFGYEVRSSIGLVIVGGLSIGTLFTIFIVPCLCVLFIDLRNKSTGYKVK
ncbi:efflux RND transporter permease subunit [Candidatus Nesciobacter abundans]|uniref:efflux RND transporter permease subunit n=1 Tax=Candidatus Nesciobacter abundans TaxID=2601668 RepID=UPI0016534F0A|nr:efflux RND transporter permease subunit [Candidatus Nesciobacter abundans]